MVEGALLKPTNSPSMVEAELEADGGSSSISLVEVTAVVKQLHSGKAPGIDEIRTEMVKALFAWESGTVPKEWQTGVVVTRLKKGYQRVCANYRSSTLLSLPGKVYSKVLEMKV